MNMKTKMIPFALAVASGTFVLGCSESTATESGEPEATSVVLSTANVMLHPGASELLSADVFDQDGQPMPSASVTWHSVQASVASVDPTGLVHGVAVGTTQVSAEAGAASASASVSVVPIPVASVRISPDAVSVEPGEMASVTASVRDASGAELPGRSITWMSDATGVATVQSTGGYGATISGVANGSATVTATVGGVLGSVSVQVATAAPIPVASVTVSPNPVSLAPGGGALVTASVRAASGTDLPGRSITWMSDATGVVTVQSTSGYAATISGVAVGVATVTATVEGLSGSLSIDVAAAPPPSLANECRSPSPEWIWCDDFDVDRLSSYFEFDPSGGSFARVAGVGTEGSTGMRAHWNQGQVAAGALHLAVGRSPDSYRKTVTRGTEDYRELYWRLYLRHQPGWTGGGGDKLSRAMVFDNPSHWGQAMIAHVWSGSGSPGRDYLVVDPASGTDAAGNPVTTGFNDFAHLRWLGAGQGTTPLFDADHVGQWYCVEAHVRLNDAGLSNGEMGLWVDGAPQVERTDLNWVGAYDNYGLNAVFVENYWNAGSPVAQERYIDNFVVSQGRIGCGS